MTTQFIKLTGLAVAVAILSAFQISSARGQAGGEPTAAANEKTPAWIAERLGVLDGKDSKFDRGVIYVDDDNAGGPWDGTFEHPYQFIQDGIDNAADGDVVAVWSGTYVENVVIDRAIVLTGENAETTIIQRNTGWVIVQLTADNAWFSGFTITSGSEDPRVEGVRVEADACSIFANRVADVQYGIVLVEGSYNSIRDNRVSNASEDSLSLRRASYNRVEGNTLENGADNGIQIGMESHDNTISGNVVANHSWNCVYLSNASNNTICGNTFSSNRLGLQIVQSSGATVSDNTFVDMRRYGISVEASSDLVITGNDFPGGCGISLDYDADEVDTWITYTIEGNRIGEAPIYFYKDSSGIAVPADAGQVILAHCDGMSVEGLTLDQAPDPVQIGGCANIAVRDNAIATHWYCNGIVLLGSSQCTISENQIVSDYDHYINTYASGISAIYVEDGEDNAIIDNTIRGFHEGVMLWHNNVEGRGNLIARNEIASFHYGVRFWQFGTLPHGDVISENWIAGCTRAGISLAYAIYVEVVDNQLWDATLEFSGTDLVHWSSHTITGNTVNDRPLYYFNGRPGVVVPEDAGQVIIADSPGFVADHLTNALGVLAAFSPGGSIADCTIMGVNASGIALRGSSFVRVAENDLIGCASGVDVDKGSHFAAVADNLIYAPTYVGVYAAESDYITITNNAIYGKPVDYLGYSGHGINLFDSDGGEISNNLITCCDEDGMWINTSDSNVIADNAVGGCGSEGIILNSSRGNLIYRNAFADNWRNAFEDSRSSNDWSIENSGNFWSDFAENPGYPDSYVIENEDGVGNGNDPYPLPVATTCPFAPGDINGSCGDVDFDDFDALVECWDEQGLGCGDYGCSDLNGDGTVDLRDFAAFSLLYGGTAGVQTSE